MKIICLFDHYHLYNFLCNFQVMDYYRCLQITRSADDDAIKRAWVSPLGFEGNKLVPKLANHVLILHNRYRLLAIQWHPDKNPDRAEVLYNFIFIRLTATFLRLHISAALVHARLLPHFSTRPKDLKRFRKRTKYCPIISCVLASTGVVAGGLREVCVYV